MQWSSSGAVGVAARDYNMYVQWDIQYIQGLQNRESCRRVRSPKAACGRHEVQRRSEEVALHAWYIYRHAAGWEAGEMARGLGDK